VRTDRINKEHTAFSNSVFKFKAASALGISMIADALDYFAAPLFDLPVIGDIFDVITVNILFSITKSKTSTAINMIEFIPFVGDFIPVYTLSTLLWISREWKNQQKSTKEERELHHILSEVDNDNNYYYYCKHNDKNIMK
jgi:hypothetical protein